MEIPMHATPRDADAVEARVVIRRPVEEVFGFYRDFRHLPNFLGDVMAVDRVGPAIFRWTVEGPLGIRVRWTIRITEERANELIRYETVAWRPFMARWEVRFVAATDAGETEVREVMKTPFGRFGRAILAFLRRPPEQEVRANLRRLKELLETGRVSDTTRSVRGKFRKRTA
jgi:uncharacterized membrane protein